MLDRECWYVGGGEIRTDKKTDGSCYKCTSALCAISYRLRQNLTWEKNFDAKAALNKECTNKCHEKNVCAPATKFYAVFP